MSIYLGNTLIAGSNGNGVEKSTTNGILKKQVSESHHPIIENNEGTIILKAGSKLYTGGYYNIITIDEDLDISNVGDMPQGTKDYAIVLYQQHSDFYDSVGGVPVEVLGKPPHNYYMNTVYYQLDIPTPNYKPVYSSGWWSATLPICIVRTDGTVEPYIKDVYQIGNACLVFKDSLKVSIPNGRNSDGTLNNLIVSSADSTLIDISGTDKIYIDSTGVLQKSSNCEYNQHENYNKVDGSNVSYAKIGDFSSIDDVIQLATKEDLKSVVNYNNISNCITHIPQDIKLELNNGTLTLKAGSKVYVPNNFEDDGTTPYFDEVIIDSDLTMTDTGDRILWCAYRPDSNTLTAAVSSETGTPVSGTYKIYYNSTENKCFVSYANVYKQTSFPICLIKSSSTGITSIDQVFNGFGYLGSTVFTLPGVKGLIPNGRNEDGTLKNIELISDKVWIRTWESDPHYKDLSIATTGIGINTNTYNEEENFVYNNAGNKVTDRFVFGKMEYSASSPYNVTSFTPKTAFHALDYNDKSIIVGWSIPSDNYVNTTFVKTAVGSYTYTAPANGYFTLGFTSNTSGNTTALYKNNVAVDKFSSAGHNGCVSFVFKKGDVIKVQIAERALYAIAFQHFFYMEGEI